MHTPRSITVSGALLLVFASLSLAGTPPGITTPPDGYWHDYRNLTKGWIQEFNKFRSEKGLPLFVWSEKMYVCLVEYTNECRSHNLNMDQIPGPCERPTQRARRVHRWNIYFFDNYTIFNKASYTPAEAVKSVASVAIIKSITNPRNNAAAVAIVERNAEEVYIIMATAAMDIGPIVAVQDDLELASAILKSDEATSADRVEFMKKLAVQKNFECSFLFMEYVCDKDPAVAKVALQGLSALADPSFVGPLILALGKAVPEIRENIAATLAKITGRKDFGTDQAKWQAWYKGAGGQVTRPFEVPSEDIELSDEEIKKLVEEFKMELKNPDAVRRIDAVRKVGRIKNSVVAKAVTKALMDKDPLVRKTAAEALEYQADKGTLKALTKALPLNKANPEVQAPIIRAIGAIGDPRAAPIVLKDLLKPGDEGVTRARIVALGNLRHPESIQGLIDFMSRWGRGARKFGKDLQASLKALTGKDFGRNRDAWRDWWDRNKKTFRFPPKKKG
ncbi:MAG: HEAT repeat domain-containing protein [Planctomycetota bacterium]|jgi:HEAT repeat protein